MLPAAYVSPRRAPAHRHRQGRPTRTAGDRGPRAAHRSAVATPADLDAETPATLAPLLAIFRDLLGPSVGADDRLLRARWPLAARHQAVYRVERLMGERLAITSVFEAPTARSLAVLLPRSKLSAGWRVRIGRRPAHALAARDAARRHARVAHAAVLRSPRGRPCVRVRTAARLVPGRAASDRYQRVRVGRPHETTRLRRGLRRALRRRSHRASPARPARARRVLAGRIDRVRDGADARDTWSRGRRGAPPRRRAGCVARGRTAHPREFDIEASSPRCARRPPRHRRSDRAHRRRGDGADGTATAPKPAAICDAYAPRSARAASPTRCYSVA